MVYLSIRMVEKSKMKLKEFGVNKNKTLGFQFTN
jgi:hypothetical protein